MFALAFKIGVTHVQTVGILSSLFPSTFRYALPLARVLCPGARGTVEGLGAGGGGIGLGWVSACTKGGDPRPVCPYLTGSTGHPPPVVWSHSRPHC